MRNIYRTDFHPADFTLGVSCNDVIVCEPILPSSWNSRLLDQDGRPSGIITPDSADDAPQALVYRVVSFSAKALEAIPGLAPNKVAIVRNMAGYTTSARVKFFMFSSQDILWLWDESELS